MKGIMDLNAIRQQIDSIDGEIIGLLSKRAGLVCAAAKLKKDEQGVRDPRRVEQVIERVKSKAVEAGFDPEIAEEIYRTIIGCFIRKEMKEFPGRIHASDKNNGFVIRKAVDRDRDAITAIFNHYVEHSFAAYPDKPVDGTFFDFMKKIIYGDAFFVAETEDGRMAGFAFLKRYHPYPAFNRVAETGYFIMPDHTRMGLGKRLLETLESEAEALGIDALLANISSHNQPSLAFHEKQGFRECGRFQRISRKFGQDVDIVWMQKLI